jgi:hypothetical protein
MRQVEGAINEPPGLVPRPETWLKAWWDMIASAGRAARPVSWPGSYEGFVVMRLLGAGEKIQFHHHLLFLVQRIVCMLRLMMRLWVCGQSLLATAKSHGSPRGCRQTDRRPAARRRRRTASVTVGSTVPASTRLGLPTWPSIAPFRQAEPCYDRPGRARPTPNIPGAPIGSGPMACKLVCGGTNWFMTMIPQARRQAGGLEGWDKS